MEQNHLHGTAVNGSACFLAHTDFRYPRNDATRALAEYRMLQLLEVRG